MNPTVTYISFSELAAYIDAKWITNNQGLITGVIGNNVVNGLLTFIEQSPLNWNRATVVSDGIAITAGSQLTPGPVIVITGTPSPSLSWADNIYNQYVFINATSGPIPLSNGFTYLDNTLTVQNSIPANQVTEIFKAPNGTWFLGNNLASAGNVPGGGVSGQLLGNNGTIPIWVPPYFKLHVAGFTSATTYSNANLSGLYFDLFVNDINRWLLGPEDPGSEWQYFQQVAGTNNGFNITIPSFNLQTLAYPIYLWPKPNPA